MSKTIVLTGLALVQFRKVIRNVDDEECAEMAEDVDRQELQIDESDLGDIESIHEIQMEQWAK
ncbi:hypothetical protein N7650_26110 [Pseudomonas sp. GD04058]|uniref:hypothetical protein n=1 Tax=Pseudomonas sp. GD04058 TaxID=2975429 RepID=UPI002446BCA4|nr:hypothetical protein [Pseudomonas sp. GD04058]MDG9886303.1 hypothetical protein [Pseudomonas sp. GD04058]